ncbi:MAG: RNA polymerase sigma-54 factor [Candidatus Omnitrophica bacterium CG11_big_fil_rev_8_21_14_0_20_45_26]|uniref:RNA polymerase sigma-54 factor n=1 Tax=Candidatus Abzuiibacterium crystallinum TaxID=1974748 RepID=A0A2H0LLR2_9BACT|nr:MAG: RNA polymerase sigma-54 factor [Candidatus Omnitrophica bacterium CG11_big_fil_rev_8_21_14_0_20_45_26]PIW63235.1 MAG: RNA polymerase sigma-54 factor [Candidatus Omnitrophica bacterium CG12_big_fil_rev_8_21_14_0_65_45_16]
MEHKLIQNQSQQLILSPQLKQYLKLLQLPLIDLQQSIEEELSQNPVLEETLSEPEEASELSVDDSIDDGESKDSAQSSDGELDRTLNELNDLDNDYRSNFNSQNDFSGESTAQLDKKKRYMESLLTNQNTLAQYLEWQLNLHSLTEQERVIAQEIIGNINDDGYFASSVEEISETTKTKVEEVEKVLKRLQTMDPPGVGGRNLSEVLLIQLKRQNSTPLAQKIVTDHLGLLQRKQIDQLAHALLTPKENVINALKVISKLEPKPGRVFYHDEPISVIPDIILIPNENDEEEASYHIEINHERIPELRINQKYRKLIRQKDIDAKTKAFLKEKIQAALLYIRALGERKSTLRQIAEQLVDYQKEFLKHGFSHLKPLRLKDVAEKLGIHESTISRAISGKYMTCPQGTIPLKNFFSNSVASTDGESQSQKSIMERIKQLIDEEDKKHPLSDAALVEQLKSEGIPIARRTAAKYRELLKILPTHLRKFR